MSKVSKWQYHTTTWLINSSISNNTLFYQEKLTNMRVDFYNKQATIVSVDASMQISNL